MIPDDRFKKMAEDENGQEISVGGSGEPTAMSIAREGGTPEYIAQRAYTLGFIVGKRAGHAAAIQAAAQICEDWSTSCWDSFRDQAMAVAQRAVNIRALTLASANSDPPDGQGQEEPEMDQARAAYLKAFSDGQLKVFETIHELSYKCKTAAEMVFKIGELYGEFASAEDRKETKSAKGESA